jgi:hypothetical protein
MAQAKERAMREKGEISGLEDVGRSGLTGLGEGAAGVIGLPMDMVNLVARGGDWVGRNTGLIEDTPEHRAWLEKSLQSVDDWLPTSDEALTAMNEYTKGYGLGSQGLFEHQPRTTMGKFARTAGELAPSLLTGPAGAGRKAVMWLGSSLASEGAGQLAEGTGYEDWARLGGAVIGGGVPKVKLRGKPLSTAEKKAAADQAGLMVEEAGERNLPEYVDSLRAADSTRNAYDKAVLLDEMKASGRSARDAYADLAQDKGRMKLFSPGEQEAIRRAGGSDRSERAARWVKTHMLPPLPVRKEIKELIRNVGAGNMAGREAGQAIDGLTGGLVGNLTEKYLQNRISAEELGVLAGSWIGTGPTLSRITNRVAGKTAEAVSDRNTRNAEKYILSGVKPGANRNEISRMIARAVLQNQGIAVGQ